MALTFEVLHSSWTADGEEFAGGVHVVEDPSDDLVRLAACGHAAGAVRLEDDAVVSDHVEDDEVSKQKLSAAMGTWIHPVRDEATGTILEPGRWSGPWYEGHIANADAATLGSSTAELEIDV